MSPLAETKSDLFSSQKFIRVKNHIFVAPPYSSSFNHQWLMNTDNINQKDIDDAGKIYQSDANAKYFALGDGWTIDIIDKNSSDTFAKNRRKTIELLNLLPE